MFTKYNSLSFACTKYPFWGSPQSLSISRIIIIWWWKVSISPKVFLLNISCWCANFPKWLLCFIVLVHILIRTGAWYFISSRLFKCWWKFRMKSFTTCFIPYNLFQRILTRSWNWDGELRCDWSLLLRSKWEFWRRVLNSWWILLILKRARINSRQLFI